MQRARVMVAMKHHYITTKLVFRQSVKARFRAVVYAVKAAHRFRTLMLERHSAGYVATRAYQTGSVFFSCGLAVSVYAGRVCTGIRTLVTSSGNAAAWIQLQSA